MGIETTGFHETLALNAEQLADIRRNILRQLLLLSEGLSRQKTAAKSLLILAGSGHARHRALPVDPAGPHSDAFNRGFKDQVGKRKSVAVLQVP